MRVRITVVATAAFVLVFALSGVLVIQRINASLEDDLRLTSERALALAAPRLEDGTDPRALVTQQFGVPIEVLDSRGTLVAGSPGGVVVGQGISSALPDPASPPGEAGSGDALYRVQTQTPSGTFTVVARPPLQSVRDTVDALRRALILLIPLLAAAIAAIVWLVVDRSLRPVERLRAQVDQISHSTITRRLDEPGTAGEIDHLARTMNSMLDRLESSSAQQQRFVSDAGHELKTPLATLRSTVEVAQRQAEPDWDVVADRILVSEQRLESLVDDLLTLARFDEGSTLPDTGREDVDLEELIVAWRTATDVDDRIAVDLGPVVAGRVRGDERELRRLVGNVLDNAVQHATRQVVVSLRSTEDGADGDAADGAAAAAAALVTFSVDDDGAGVPVREREMVFDRFARVQEARERQRAIGVPDPGTGLGLAIARACTIRHGGTIAIEDSPLGGARFVVRLPSDGRARPTT
jgi:signal transduction histidine kinase